MLAMVAEILALAFGISIAVLLTVHTYIIMTNLSTIEIGMFLNNPFRMGNIKSNIEQTFGKDWRRWLVPMESKEKSYDGINILLVPSSYRR